MKAILTHPNADFDAIASLLGAYKLHPDMTPILSKQQNRNVQEFLALYQNGLPFQQQDELSDVTEVLLVDTQRLPDFKGLSRKIPFRVIDHHPRGKDTPHNSHILIDETGANATLLVERLRSAQITLNSLEATLLALGIYEDTGSLTYGTTTPRDIQAAAWLLEHHAVLDTVRRFLTPPLTPEQYKIYETLLQSAETRNVQGYPVTIAAIRLDKYMFEIASIAHRLRDALDPSALFLVVEMPDYTQLVCRSKEDAIDVSAIARLFDGGGHDRAAAAAVRGFTLSELVNYLWDTLRQQVKPAYTIADLMSVGVHTIRPDDRIGDIVSRIRRVGHEGYPVVENGRVVGLLRLREADKAIEHGLQGAAVREIMQSGEITLTPTDSIYTFEQLIVSSGWGQIPVVQDGKIIGIVTRTDLIKHWARIHPTPTVTPQPLTITDEQIQTILGADAASWINLVTRHAQTTHTSLYLVGGVVRDLLLNRVNLDIDFVVETDAIAFAKGLQQAHGGEITAHTAFGTAKWFVDNHQIDFATARNEFYEHPTALPTVYAGSIKLDLGRRDFTINTLAIQLSPVGIAGRVLDFFNGLDDLHNQLIRVLHSLSFVDDPTRILRAVRFAQRLDFTIEPRTLELIATAREMLRRITGERVRNELALLLREPKAAEGLVQLEALGALSAIHPMLHFTPQNAADLRSNPVELRWHVWLCRIEPDNLQSICERLLIGRTEAESLLAASELLHNPAQLADTDAKPSQITFRLDGVPEIALQTVLILSDNEFMRQRIRQYLEVWRFIKANTTGNTLKAMGLPPGPRYKQILDRLRAARIDGEIISDEAETTLLNSLIR